MHRARDKDVHAPVTQGRESTAAPNLDVRSDFDTQLMLQVQTGDSDAANMLVRRNFGRIAKYIARLVGRDRASEDLAQDVFLQALTRADRYEPTARVTTWLYRIATNTALNYLKSAAVRRESSSSAPATLETAQDAAPPDHELTMAELRGRVTAAIDALPHNQRVALTLFQYEDCSYEQIAEVLGVSIEAVRSLLLRARTALRRELNDLA